MTSKVTYRFKSMREPAFLKFKGNFISLGDLTKRVIEDRKLVRQQADFELVVMNDDTKVTYKGPKTKIPKNSRLIISRVNRVSANSGNDPNPSSTFDNSSNTKRTNDPFGTNEFENDDNDGAYILDAQYSTVTPKEVVDQQKHFASLSNTLSSSTKNKNDHDDLFHCDDNDQSSYLRTKKPKQEE